MFTCRLLLYYIKCYNIFEFDYYIKTDIEVGERTLRILYIYIMSMQAKLR